MFLKLKKRITTREDNMSQNSSRKDFLIVRNLNQFDKWRTYALQVALNLLPAIEEIKREIDKFNSEIV